MKHYIFLLALPAFVNFSARALEQETESTPVREITYTITLYGTDETDEQWQEIVNQAKEIAKDKNVVATTDHLVKTVAGVKSIESKVQTDVIIEFSDGTCQYSTEIKACLCQNEQGRCGCSKPKPQRCACGGVKPAPQQAPASQPAEQVE